ncbi:hypothetical protein SD70_18765 [Gordoniibacillus kamchatkensis]|uniref:Helix-turn-helix domain-containing protein n=1 Tax=Gordoniibacillus kamchatkensis TaxID=1590651 RepID=A0ABR5AF40_9BACL|nr:helix-turn-helix domain-containing protein [Paenibacillus sp. VKM B-2647]KIL39675.1 hypothetical protein SD70_18765 [Paenibacillus sp. VKM B-2647]
MSSDFASEKLISVQEAAKKFGIADWAIRVLIRNGKIPSAKRTKIGLVFPEEELVRIRLEEEQNKAALVGYRSMDEACKELNLSLDQVSHLIRKGHFSDVKKLKSKWYISDESFAKFKADKLRAEKLLNTQEVAKRLRVSRSQVQQLISDGKIVPELKFLWNWMISEDELKRYEDSILDRTKYLTLEEVGNELSKSVDQIRVMIRNGTFDYVEYKRKYYVSLESLNDYKSLLEAKTFPERFEYYFNKFQIPTRLKQTLDLYRDFALLKLNAHKQSEERMKAILRKYLKVAEIIIRLFPREIQKITDKEMELLLKDDIFLPSDLNVLVTFISYCQANTECRVKKTYTLVKKKNR